MDLAILLLAAGQSSRMRGADKLLETVESKPLISVMAKRALEVSDAVYVTLPSLDHPRAVALEDLTITPVPVPEAQEGMGASIRAGMKALKGAPKGVMILPVDMPDLSASDLRHVAAQWQASPQSILRGASRDDLPGHPVIFPQRVFSRLAELHGDRGARDILAGEMITRVPLPGRNALTDLDTPEAWAAWRARNG
ncbi:MAG: nucleotidyltransferase family protein [Pseudooceanicola atlanticus]